MLTPKERRRAIRETKQEAKRRRLKVEKAGPALLKVCESLLNATHTILTWPFIFHHEEKCLFCSTKHELQFLSDHSPDCPARILQEAYNEANNIIALIKKED